jgi:RsiW-degrading membrane proteinase PrsW (M82 family)
MTMSGQIHNSAAGLLGFMILATVFIAFQFIKREQLKPFGKNMLVLTVILWGSELALIVTMGIYMSETNGMITPETPIGWLGRVVIVICAIWVWACTNYLQKSNFKN